MSQKYPQRYHPFARKPWRPSIDIETAKGSCPLRPCYQIIYVSAVSVLVFPEYFISRFFHFFESDNFVSSGNFNRNKTINE